MQVSIVDLRYHTKKILSALENAEQVEILYHGKPKALLIPYKKKKGKTKMRFKDHPAFGMYRSRTQSVAKEVRALRKDRFDDI